MDHVTLEMTFPMDIFRHLSNLLYKEKLNEEESKGS